MAARITIATNKSEPTRQEIEELTKARWSIEVYHRELKQTCGIERCQSRTGRAQRNHIFLAIASWLNQHRIRCQMKMGSDQRSNYHRNATSIGYLLKSQVRNSCKSTSRRKNGTGQADYSLLNTGSQPIREKILLKATKNGLGLILFALSKD